MKKLALTLPIFLLLCGTSAKRLEDHSTDCPVGESFVANASEIDCQTPASSASPADIFWAVNFIQTFPAVARNDWKTVEFITVDTHPCWNPVMGAFFYTCPSTKILVQASCNVGHDGPLLAQWKVNFRLRHHAPTPVTVMANPHENEGEEVFPAQITIWVVRTIASGQSFAFQASHSSTGPGNLGVSLCTIAFEEVT